MLLWSIMSVPLLATTRLADFKMKLKNTKAKSQPNEKSIEWKTPPPPSTNDDRNEKRRWGKKHWEQQQQQQRTQEQLTVYRSKTNVSCIQLLLYNVSNNVQRLKDFHHFFFAFHSLLLFRCCFFFVFFRACLFVVRLPLLLSWVVGAIFPAA